MGSYLGVYLYQLVFEKNVTAFEEKKNHCFKTLWGNVISVYKKLYTLSSIQLLSHVQLFATPRTAGHQAFLFITNSRSLMGPQVIYKNKAELPTILASRNKLPLMMCFPDNSESNRRLFLLNLFANLNFSTHFSNYKAL